PGAAAAVVGRARGGPGGKADAALRLGARGAGRQAGRARGAFGPRVAPAGGRGVVWRAAPGARGALCTAREHRDRRGSDARAHGAVGAQCGIGRHSGDGAQTGGGRGKEVRELERRIDVLESDLQDLTRSLTGMREELQFVQRLLEDPKKKSP